MQVEGLAQCLHALRSSLAAPTIVVSVFIKTIHSRAARAILSKRYLSNYRHDLPCFLKEPSVTQGNIFELHLKFLPDDAK